MGLWRRHVHIAMGGFALVLRWFPFAGACALAVAAVVFNVYVVPRLPAVARSIHRDSETPGALRGGIFWYPVSVLIALCAFPLPVAAAGWGFLAVGDGAAGYVGERISSPRLPWHGETTIGGAAAFLAFGSAAALGLFLFVRGNLAGSAPWWQGTAVAAHCASVGTASLAVVVVGVGFAAAVIESLPWRVDDNLTVCLGSGTLLTAVLAIGA